MMNKNDVLAWARSLVDANPDTLSDPDGYLRHTAQVYDLAGGVVRNVLSRYPNIPLIAEEVLLGAGLHDIGRPLQRNQIFHEPRGARYAEQKGLEKGVAASPKDVCRIAQMFRSHGFAYEYWLDPDCSDLRKGIEPLESCLLVPRTWQEAIVAYSDLASHNGERIKIEDRLRELLQRYEKDPEYQDGRVVRAAKNRILELSERVEALEAGRLSEEDIVGYGFL